MSKKLYKSIESSKLSIYNTFIQITDTSIILYNSFKNNYILIDASSHKCILDIDNHNKPNNVHTKLLSELRDQFFIVPKSLIEEDFLLNERIKKYDDPSRFNLVINPTLNCNLSCWYCYETKTKEKMTPIVIESIHAFIKNTIEQNNLLEKFELSFFGGEPLIHFYNIVLPTIKITRNLCHHNNIENPIGFTTNGTLIDQEMICELAKYTPINFQITLDGNRTKHDRTRFSKSGAGTYDLIIDSIKRLIVIDGFHVIMRLNITKDNIEDFIDVIDDIKGIEKQYLCNLSIAFERVWQDYKTGDISEIENSVRKRFEDEGFHVDDLDYLASPKWCSGNKKNSAIINYNGEVFKCTARDFKTENKEGVINTNGTIAWDSKIVEKRYQALFNDPICFKCRIGPICTERCSQKSMENGTNACPYNETEKDDLILNRFYALVYQKTGV